MSPTSKFFPSHNISTLTQKIAIKKCVLFSKSVPYSVEIERYYCRNIDFNYGIKLTFDTGLCLSKNINGFLYKMIHIKVFC